VSPTDRVRARKVRNLVKLIGEHLEAMQRDAHGLEYDPWRVEVDHLWKETFRQISIMPEDTQQSCLEMIREPWTSYFSSYVAASSGSHT
jgi:hypothetical protein